MKEDQRVLGSPGTTGGLQTGIGASLRVSWQFKVQPVRLAVLDGRVLATGLSEGMLSRPHNT